MPVTFRAPEPVRFDVDPPDEDARPLLGYAPGEIDEEWLDQLLNKGKRGVNWLADQLLGRTAEEEFETAMVEFANPLISLVPRQTLKELLRRSSRVSGGAYNRVDPPTPDAVGGWRELDTFPQGVETLGEMEHSPDVRRAAEWVAQRFPRTQSHMEMINYSPLEYNPEGRGAHGLAAYFNPNTRSLKVNPEFGQTVSPPLKNIWIRTDPSSRFQSDIPTDELVSSLSHELTHAGQQLRGMSRANTSKPGSGYLWDLSDSDPRKFAPSQHPSVEIRELEDYIAYLDQPIERSARLSGAKNRLNYLREAALEIGEPYQGTGSVRAEAKRADLTLQRLARDYWDGVDDAVKARFEHPDAPAFDLWFNTEFKPALNGGGARWQRLAREMAQDISDQPLDAARARRNSPAMQKIADDVERAYQERQSRSRHPAPATLRGPYTMPGTRGVVR
jgi:hypothetical protein